MKPNLFTEIVKRVKKKADKHLSNHVSTKNKYCSSGR